MRLLIISKRFYHDIQYPDRCAQALQSIKVASALAQQGVDVRVLAGFDTDSPVVSSRESSIVPVHYVPYSTARGQHGLGLFLRRIWSAGAYFFLTSTGWARAVVTTALEVIAQHQPDAILTITGPTDAHFAGLILRKTCRIPWVASFSDPWPPRICPVPYNKKYTILQEWKDYRTLRCFLYSCDAIHMPSKYALELAARHTSDRILEKAAAIPHIGSPVSVSPIALDGYLLHIGELGWRRAIPSLPAAVKYASQELSGRFRGLICVGQVSPEFTQLVSQAGAERYVMVRPSVKPETAGALAAGASALLVIEAAMEYSPYLPSKFADYAATKRPIIAITPRRSAIRDYLAQYGGGIAASYEHDEIVCAIKSTFSGGMALSQHAEWESSLSNVFSAERVSSAYLGLIMKAIRRSNTE